MMRAIVDLFRPAPHIALIEDPSHSKTQYAYWRTRMFYGSFIGYVFYYFSRKSLSFAMPALAADLGLSKSDLGILISLLSITYGLSKFVSGIAADRSNPRYFMSIGLIITGFLNILFGFSSSLWLFALIWALNGWFQGFGWPPALRILVHWFSKKERGRFAAVWNTSHSLGGALIPIVAALCIQWGGWRWALWMPGILCVCMGLFVMNRLRDTPQSLGLPRIEDFHKESSETPVDEEKELSISEILFRYVLINPAIWALSLANMCLYVVRTALNDWSMLYFIEVRGFSDIQAASMVTWFEVGGFIGMLAAGYLSDRLFKGGRGLISILLMVLTAFPILGLWYLPVGQLWCPVLLFLTGFFLFGPQMLVGCIAAEISHKKAAATASGVTGCFAYVGAALAGYPLGTVLQQVGWDTFFGMAMAMSFLSAIFFIPIWYTEIRSSWVLQNQAREI